MESEVKGEYEGLSYSSASLILNCETKFSHHKVLGTKPDEDIEENSDALTMGSSFHEILEATLHRPEGIKESFEKVKHKYMLDTYSCGILEAMVASYLDKHRSNPFKVIACELEIRTPTYLGYVDAIAQNDAGDWIIIDLKTAARLFGDLDRKLPDDFQLNIYTYYREHLAKQLNLDMDKFVGCSYRVTLKSKLKQKKTEARGDYMQRLLSQCISYDYFIDSHLLSPEKFGKLHKRLHDKSIQIRRGEHEPIPNYGSCEMYFRKCNFWSQCHKLRASDEVDLTI